MEMKILLSVLSLVSAFIYLGIGVYSYSKSKSSRGNRSFLLLCVAYAIWAFANGFEYIAVNPVVYQLWDKLSAFGWCLTSAITLYFVLQISESHWMEKSWFRKLLLIPAMMLLFVALTMYGPGSRTPQVVDRLFYRIEAIYNFSYLLISLGVLYRWGKRSTSIRVKKQSSVILIASSIPFFVNYSVTNGMQYFSHINFPNISQLYAVVTVIGIYYAINKYKFLYIQENILLDQITYDIMDMIFILDVEGKIIRQSEQVSKVLQFEPEELLHRGFESILDEPTQTLVKQLRKEKGNFQLKDVTIVLKNEDKIPVNLSFRQVFDKVLKDELGEVVVVQDNRLVYELEKKNLELQNYVGQLTAAEERLLQQYNQNLENEKKLKKSEERFRAIFEKAPLGINLSDSVTGRFYESNSKYAEILGRSIEEITSTDWRAFTHPDDIKENQELEDRLARSEAENFRLIKRYVKPDDSIVWVGITVAKIELEERENPCEICLVEDITEQRKNEEALRNSEYTFRKLFNESSDPIVILEKDHIIDCNNATLEIFGLNDKNGIVGKDNSDVSPLQQPDGSQSKEKYLEIIGKLDSLCKVKFEWWYKRADDEIFPVEIMLTSIFLNGKRVIHAIWRDINERKKMEQKLEYLNYHDQLTGLYNRRFFEEELERLDVSRNYPLSIIMSDVNGLKLMNDSFGHIIGDQLLRKVAVAIQKGCRGDDVVARLGGDEFVVLLPNTDEEETELIIKRIKTLTNEEKIGSLDISISFGYDIKRESGIATDEILKNAENMMYKNKMFEGPSVRSNTISTMLNTLHEKNKREEIHSQRVAELSKQLGLAAKMNETELDELVTVAMLHDIGKITLDDQILNNPGALNADQWAAIKRHPEIGFRILNTVPEMSELAMYVLAHHERWDGSGYPRGLVAEEIPLQSRIIAIADAYDAMTSERSYRPSLGEETARRELATNAGSQFDATLVDLFLNQVLGKQRDG